MEKRSKCYSNKQFSLLHPIIFLYEWKVYVSHRELRPSSKSCFNLVYTSNLWISLLQNHRLHFVLVFSFWDSSYVYECRYHWPTESVSTHPSHIFMLSQYFLLAFKFSSLIFFNSLIPIGVSFVSRYELKIHEPPFQPLYHNYKSTQCINTWSCTRNVITVKPDLRLSVTKRDWT